MSVFIYIFAKNDVIMKKFIVFFIFVSSVAQMNVEAQNFLDEGNAWTYFTTGYVKEGVYTDHNYETIDGEQIDFKYDVIYRYEKFNVKGEREIDGKIYKDIWRSKIQYSGGQADYYDSFVETRKDSMYVTSYREEDGKIYANAEYFDRIAWYADNDVLCPVYNFEKVGNEYIIYDFNKSTTDDVLPYIGSTENLIYPSHTSCINEIFFALLRDEYYESHLNLFFRGDELVYQAPNVAKDPFYPDVDAPNKRYFMLKEGRTWNYKTHDYMHNTDTYFAYTVQGDTVVGGRWCKKIYKLTADDAKAEAFMYKFNTLDGCKSELHGYMYEDGKKVYSWNGGSWVLAYDFDLQIGDEVNMWDESLYVGAIDTIMTTTHVYPHLYRSFQFGIKGEEFCPKSIVAIEGIGSTDDLLSPSLYYANTQTMLQSYCEAGLPLYTNRSKSVYKWKYAYVKDWTVEGNIVHGKKEEVTFYISPDETMQLGGKTYNVVGILGHPKCSVGMRIDGSRIYVNLDNYIEFLKACEKEGIPTGDPDNIPYLVSSNGEMCLYDFKNSPSLPGESSQEYHTNRYAYQVRLKNFELYDDIEIYNQEKTDIMHIIAGIGCIDSPGLFFGYWNPSKQCEGYFGCLESFCDSYKTETPIYQTTWQFDNLVDGIEDIEFESKEKVDTRIFNLKGQQLSAPQRGINIIGGKKVYIR